MAYIDNVLVSDVEEAFGLNPGDIKLINSPECAPLLKQNAWTRMENTLAKLNRFEVIKESSFSKSAQLVLWFGNPIFNFPEGGKLHQEKVLDGLFRIRNMNIDYHTVGWVDERRRLLHPV